MTHSFSIGSLTGQIHAADTAILISTWSAVVSPALCGAAAVSEQKRALRAAADAAHTTALRKMRIAAADTDRIAEC